MRKRSSWRNRGRLLVLVVLLSSTSGCWPSSERLTDKPVDIRRFWGKAGEQPPTPAWDWILKPLEEEIQS